MIIGEKRQFEFHSMGYNLHLEKNNNNNKTHAALARISIRILKWIVDTGAIL